MYRIIVADHPILKGPAYAYCKDGTELDEYIESALEMKIKLEDIKIEVKNDN